MKISRRGFRADHGTRSILLEDSIVTWDKNNEVIVLKKSQVRDFSIQSEHDYEVEISLSEMKEMISVIGEKPVNESPEKISEAFSPVLRQLIRLVNTCVGSTHE